MDEIRDMSATWAGQQRPRQNLWQEAPAGPPRRDSAKSHCIAPRIGDRERRDGRLSRLGTSLSRPAARRFQATRRRGSDSPLGRLSRSLTVEPRSEESRETPGWDPPPLPPGIPRERLQARGASSTACTEERGEPGRHASRRRAAADQQCFPATHCRGSAVRPGDALPPRLSGTHAATRRPTPPSPGDSSRAPASTRSGRPPGVRAHLGEEPGVDGRGDHPPQARGQPVHDGDALRPAPARSATPPDPLRIMSPHFASGRIKALQVP